MVEFLEDVDKWKAGKITSAYDIRHRHFRYDKDYCRVNGDIVETTQSANAPLVEVKTMLKRMKQGKSIKGAKLGHYTVLSYDKEVLTIGCHKFQQRELDWLSGQLI